MSTSLLFASLWAASVYAATATVNQAIVFGSDTASGQAAVAGLTGYSVPFIAYNTAASTSASTLPLFAGATANFSMIILGSGIIGFSADQWSQLYTYQEQTNARLVSLYDLPNYGASIGYTASSSLDTVAVVPANAIGSTAAGLPAVFDVSLSGMGTTYPATVLNASAVVPVLSFSSSTGSTSVAAAVYSFTTNREQLSFFYQIAGWQAASAGSITKYTNEILISWISKGTFGYVAPTPLVVSSVVTQAIVFGSDSASASSVIVGLKAFKVPFIEYTTAVSTAFTSLPLTVGSTGNFSMIILGSGVIGFSAAQWSELYSYQEATKARLVSLYDVPNSGSSVSFASGSFSSSGIYTVSPVDSVGSTDAGYPSSFSIALNTATYGGIYPATIVNASVATPVLSFGDSVAAIVYNFTTAREQLSIFYQIAGWDTGASLSTYTNDVLISWVSKGLYSKAPAPVVAHTVQVQTRALILSPGDGFEEYPVATLHSYGMDYDVVAISGSTVSNNPLDLEITANSVGRYSLIVLSNGQMISGFTNGSYLSTLYPWQWKQLHDYQQYYGVRLVALNDVPSAPGYIGKTSGFNGAIGCDSANSLSMTPSSNVFTAPAGLKSTWSLVAGDGIVGG
ncbi:UNVERIFIED_CONTAM: hypothetical protein HDU68_008534 [Siphonaria sp. JEL0065]|nr:hypothetical protein HDU68_008534 [Siphonaria sp. JEL0065]